VRYEIVNARRYILIGSPTTADCFLSFEHSEHSLLRGKETIAQDEKDFKFILSDKVEKS